MLLPNATDKIWPPLKKERKNIIRNHLTTEKKSTSLTNRNCKLGRRFDHSKFKLYEQQSITWNSKIINKHYNVTHTSKKN
jgi:hypothetical protein